MPTTPTQPPVPYMLFFRNSGPENHQHLTAEQRQQLVIRWNAWFEGLVARGQAVEGQPLELDTRIVSGPGGTRVVDGPFPEAKEAIGGFWILQCKSLDECIEWVKRVPVDALPGAAGESEIIILQVIDWDEFVAQQEKGQ